MNPQVWWYVARAGGLVAWALLGVSVVWGLLLSTSFFGGLSRPAWLLDLHRFVGGLAVVFTGVHLAGLVLDSYVEFGVEELLVPMASTWKPGPVAFGVVAMYVLVAVEVTSLLRRRLPKKLWHVVHVSSLPLFVIATVHTLWSGTDVANPALRWTALVLIQLILLLTLTRLTFARRAARRARRAEGAERGAAPVPAPSTP